MSAPTTMQRAQAFLAEQRRLGFQARNPGYALISFARFVERRRHQGPLTVELMAEWARRDKGQRGTAATWARRLKILRPFARWMRQFEPRTAVPDESIFGPVPGRVTPHIYRDEEIVALLAAARALHPKGGLRPATFEAVFGLLASTGLRVSEALALRDADVDLGAGTLTVRRTKFMKSRLVPLHWSTVEALARYRRRRVRVTHSSAQMPFFIGTRPPIGPSLESTPGASRLHRAAQPAGMD
jgi:integrase